MDNRKLAQPTHVREGLDWFLRNLEFQLDDAYQEAQGFRVEHFWDTADIRRAVLGVEDLLENGQTWNIRKFREPGTLVACLAADGWLGSVRLLEPHQAEFARSLREGFGLQGRRTSPNQLTTFLEAIHLPNTNDLELNEFASRSAADRRKIIARYAGVAGDLFKAVQSAGGDWKTRLAEMYRQSSLNLSVWEGTDYPEIFADPLFRDLRNKLTIKRPTKSLNNLADATCLCILSKALQRRPDQVDKVSPRFFASRSLFVEVLHETSHTARLTYEGLDGKRFSILRDSDYYVFKATFGAKAERFRDAQLPSIMSQLATIREKVKELLDASEPLSPEVVNKITLDGKPLGAVIDDLRSYWFLESVWLPYAASDAVAHATQTLEHLQARTPESKQFLEGVTNAIETATRALDKNAKEYRWFSNLWRDVEDHVSRLLVRFRRKHLEQERISRAFGVGRFGIPAEYKIDIETILGGLLSEEDESFRRELTRLSTLCVDAGGVRKDSRARTILVTVLWILEMDATIRDLNVDFGKEATWLTAIAGASAVRARRGREALRAVHEIEQRHGTTQDDMLKAKLAITVAYLYFQMWRMEDGEVAWRSDSGDKVSLPQSGNSDYSRSKALEFAESAYEAGLKEIDVKVYAINIYLYYLTEVGTDFQFVKARRLVQELTRWRDDSNVWEYRYDDTLARYFHRRSTSLTSDGEKRNLLEQARRHIDAAVAESPGDRAVEAYQSILVDMLAS